jgi:hypothetical protein
VRWVADAVERWAIDRLVPYAKNARLHSKHQIGLIAASMKKWGVTMPMLVDEAGSIIAGHGRVLAAKLLGYKELPVLVARGWSEEDKKAYRIADNKLAELASWDEELLGFEMSELRGVNYDLSLTGYTEEEIKLLTSVDDLIEDAKKSALLELVNVTVDEPRHAVAHGDHWVLGEKHHLICASVISDWKRWSKLLSEGSLFCAYPGVFVPFSEKASHHALVMVQPDPYIAGHILDRFEECGGSLVKQ